MSVSVYMVKLVSDCLYLARMDWMKVQFNIYIHWTTVEEHWFRENAFWRLGLVWLNLQGEFKWMHALLFGNLVYLSFAHFGLEYLYFVPALQSNTVCDMIKSA